MKRLSECRQYLLCCVILAVFALQACGQHTPVQPQASSVVSDLRSHYEEGLDRLPLSLQRHYAQRLYRVTGEERFLPYQQRHAQQLINTLERDVRGLTLQADYAFQRDRMLSEARATRTERQRQRAALFDAYPGMAFATDLVFRMVQLEYYGLLDVVLGVEADIVYQVLTDSDFGSFLLSEAAIRHYAAQAANQVWFLYQLGVVDLRNPFIQRFQEIYPTLGDADLSRAEWHNKIYGMTHIVIAASRYYQDTLPPGSFAWITDYFIDQLPLLLDQATEDILAEVGISLALTGQLSHPAVEHIRRSLITAYDAEARMIPSPGGSTDFARGEHRNVLAIMLLSWPDQLHPGPHIEPDTLDLFMPLQPMKAPVIEKATGNQ